MKPPPAASRGPDPRWAERHDLLVHGLGTPERLIQQDGILNRLIPATMAVGAFVFTMYALPGTPQNQNILPAGFFKTDAWGAPWLGVIGAFFILVAGLAYFAWRRRQAARAREGYRKNLANARGLLRGEAAECLGRRCPAHLRRRGGKRSGQRNHPRRHHRIGLRRNEHRARHDFQR